MAVIWVVEQDVRVRSVVVRTCPDHVRGLTELVDGFCAWILRFPWRCILLGGELQRMP